jgi:hypothetical protein
MISASNQFRLVRLAKQKLLFMDLYFNEDETDFENGVRGGVATLFMPLTENFAIKFSRWYNKECEIDKVFQKQQEAYELGAAPYCFGYFELEIENNQTICGYITEIVMTANYIGENELIKRLGGKNPWINEDEPKIVKLRKRLEKIYFKFRDVHINNLGFRGNQLVCIDFVDD